MLTEVVTNMPLLNWILLSPVLIMAMSVMSSLSSGRVTWNVHPSLSGSDRDATYSRSTGETSGATPATIAISVSASFRYPFLRRSRQLRMVCATQRAPTESATAWCPPARGTHPHSARDLQGVLCQTRRLLWQLLSRRHLVLQGPQIPASPADTALARIAKKELFMTHDPTYAFLQGSAQDSFHCTLQ